MKTLLILFCLLFTSIASLPQGRVYASNTYFAQIIEENCYLYSSSSSETTTEIFKLPKTYFVELISSDESFYYVKYYDVYGYVKKTSVKPIIGTPITPHLSQITFRVFVPSGANLRSTPENLGANNLLYSIPFLETNLEYYGEVEGEEAISKKGTTWYYCKYYVNNLSYTGYIYAPLCDCLSPIPDSTEVFEFYEGELDFGGNDVETSTQPLSEFSPTLQTIIIVAVSLPCLLFIYLLFKPTKIAETARESKSSKSSKPKKISRLKRSDYYELDDDFN